MGKKGGMAGVEQWTLKWAVDSKNGPARIGICNSVQRATITSKKVVLY
jgi:hypothetical protein